MNDTKFVALFDLHDPTKRQQQKSAEEELAEVIRAQAEAQAKAEGAK